MSVPRHVCTDNGKTHKSLLDLRFTSHAYTSQLIDGVYLVYLGDTQPLYSVGGDWCSCS